MKHIITILVISLLMACNNEPKKEESIKSDPKTKLVKQEETKPMASGDYSSLISNYNCDMDISEVARVLEVPETDISITENTNPSKCHFRLKGFGKDSGGNQSKLMWGFIPNTKADNKKEINNYLKNQKEYAANPKVYLHMSIALAETGDTYIAQQPAHGRVIIYNENYDNFFVLNYGRKGAFKRTQEQHFELKDKMTNLANYLLKKHRK